MTCLPPTRKPRARQPIPVVVTVGFVRIPVDEFVRRWRPVIARAAASLATTHKDA